MMNLAVAAWALSLSATVDDPVALHLEKLRVFYTSVRGFRIVYKKSFLRAATEPKAYNEKSAWHLMLSSGAGPIKDEPQELRYQYPLMRLEWDSVILNNRKPVGVDKDVHLLRDGRMYRWRLRTGKGLIDNAAKGLGVFEGGFAELLGFNLPYNLRLTLADLCELRRNPNVDSFVDRKNDGAVRFRIGPRIPKEFCGGLLGTRGSVVLTFASANSVLPETSEFTFCSAEQSAASSKENDPESKDVSRYRVELSDFRPVVDRESNRTLSLPHRVERVTEASKLAFVVDVFEVNPRFAAETFVPPNVDESRRLKDGVVPHVKSEHLNEIAKNVAGAKELLSPEMPRGDNAQFGWSKYAWIVTGVLFASLVVEALRQRRNRES